jgi:hypothetical protein
MRGSVIEDSPHPEAWRRITYPRYDAARRSRNGPRALGRSRLACRCRSKQFSGRFAFEARCGQDGRTPGNY